MLQRVSPHGGLMDHIGLLVTVGAVQRKGLNWNGCMFRDYFSNFLSIGTKWRICVKYKGQNIILSFYLKRKNKPIKPILQACIPTFIRS